MHPSTDPIAARAADSPPAARRPDPVAPDAPPAERVEALGKAARQIGHDINNCLGVVGGRTELIGMYLDRNDVEKARQGLDVILAQVERMKELTENLRYLNPRD